MRSRGFGTDVSGGFDPAAMRANARGKVDTRHWVSNGTVCSIGASSGECDFADKRAVLVGPEGVEVDVRLEPMDTHVTCRYAGIQAGEVTIFAPIHPGDEVLVVGPGGGYVHPVIVAILQSRSNRMPLGTNRRPLFDNKRLLVHAKTVPIDIRASDQAGLLLEQDGTVTISGSKEYLVADDVRLVSADATEAIPLGTSQKLALDTLAIALDAYVTAMGPVDPTGGTATSTMLNALAAFEAAQYLSTNARVK